MSLHAPHISQSQLQEVQNNPLITVRKTMKMYKLEGEWKHAHMLINLTNQLYMHQNVYMSDVSSLLHV